MEKLLEELEEEISELSIGNQARKKDIRTLIRKAINLDSEINNQMLINKKERFQIKRLSLLKKILFLKKETENLRKQLVEYETENRDFNREENSFSVRRKLFNKLINSEKNFQDELETYSLISKQREQIKDLEEKGGQKSFCKEIKSSLKFSAFLGSFYLIVYFLVCLIFFIIYLLITVKNWLVSIRRYLLSKQVVRLKMLEKKCLNKPVFFLPS